MELAIEIQRAKARGAVQLSSFTTSDGSAMAVTPLELATIQKGDIILIPENWKDNILASPVRGSFREVPVTDANGIEIGTRKEQVSAAYVYTTAERNGKTVPVQLYPSYFTKSRQEVDANGRRGEFKRAEGSAVDFVQNYATFDEAFEAMKGRKILVKDLKRFKAPRFGQNDEVLAPAQTQNVWVPVLDFVD